MSNIMNNLHALGLNPFAVVLLAESLLKSQYVKHSSEKPLTFFFPVQRSDCDGWRGVRITLEAVPTDPKPAVITEPVSYVDCGECPRISTGCAGRCAKSGSAS